MPRKYVKHDYFKDLNERMSLWQSIRKQVIWTKRRANNATNSLLKKTQDRAMDVLNSLTQKDSELLLSPEVEKAYDDIQALLDQSAKECSSMANLCAGVNAQDPNLDRLIDSAVKLKLERSIQNQRIEDIKVLITHLQKQINREEGRADTQDQKSEDDLSESGYSPLHFVVDMFIHPRVFRLRRLVIKEKEEIKRIGLEQQKRAKEICKEGDKIFSRQKYIKEFDSFYKKLRDGVRRQEPLQRDLKNALMRLEQVVAAGKESKKEKKSETSQVSTEKVEQDAILKGMERALNSKENLILKGKQRTIGLSFNTLEEILDDDAYKADIIEHLQKFLNTPPESDFIVHGAKRWKVFISNANLYELSISPKSGNSESMPRLYFKKKLFQTNGSVYAITNKKAAEQEKQNIQTLWVGVKRGTKRGQNKDGELAKKVLFENDGEPHRSVMGVNSLPWLVVDMSDGKPSLSLSKMKNREK